jgi:polyisoprenoid-binding protein YceI
MTIENARNVRQDAPPYASRPIPTGRYRLHPELTTVAFSAKKFGVFTIRGTMQLQSGAFTVARPLERSTLHATLAAWTFTTPMRKRDEHVKSATLLDTATYPTIVFDSTEVARRPDGSWDVRGLLAVHGQVAPATLTISSPTLERGGLVRLEATAEVDRRQFGVTALRAAASSRIQLRIEAVGTPVH